MKFFKKKKPPPEVIKVLDDKTLLKHAREYIEGGDMKEAKKNCKKVLRNNKTNYMALVLLGKSYETTENAVLTYEKAIEIRPEYPLAWQGLANYYERKNCKNAQKQLLKIYEKILTFKNVDNDYTVKTLRKYCQLSRLLKYQKSINTIVQYMTQEHDHSLINAAKLEFIALLISNVPCNKEDLKKAIEIIKHMNDNHPNDDDLQEILGRLIFKKNADAEFADAVKEIMELELFSASVSFREWLCHELCITFVSNKSFFGFDIDTHIDELTNGIKNTRYGGLLTAIMMYKSGSYKDAYKKTIKSLHPVQLTILPEAMFLLHCSLGVNNVALAETITDSFFKYSTLDHPDFIDEVNKTLMSVYLQNECCYEAVTTLKKIPIKKIGADNLMKFANLYCKRDLQIREVNNILASTDYLKLFQIFDCLKNKQYSNAITMLLSYNKHPVKHYFLGYAYWEDKQYPQCLESFLRARELLPDIPKIHSCLGVYYFQHERNSQEARKHLEACYNLCKTDTDVIQMLSVVYDDLKCIDMELNLLQNSVDIARHTRQFWIYTRLGRLNFAKGNINDAIKWLKESVNINPQDITAFEWLGDAYFKQKLYDDAITAYEKVVAISNETPVLISIFHKIGCAYTQIKIHGRAINIYFNILQVDPENALAVRGITNNLLTTAQKHITEYSYDSARMNVQDAIDHITRAMLYCRSSTTYMQLYGDCLLCMAKLPRQHCFIKIQKRGQEKLKKGKSAMFKMAIEHFSNVAKFRDSLALYKCAYAYLLYYLETKNVSYCHTSYNLAVLCVKNNSNAWRYWDLLGKVCYFLQKYEMSHYSFLRAISLNEERSVSIVWCNLGVLYLKIDKDRLANYCFAVGRDSLPPYPRAWIGDGLLAEIIQEEGNIGLFTPTPNSNFELLNEDYIDWMALINEMSSQQNEPVFDSAMEAFRSMPNSIEITEWYLSFEQETAWGCCSLGEIQEKKGLLRSALSCYQRAFAMADDEQKADILIRKARVLINMKQYYEAVRVYNGVDDINLNAVTALAYEFFRGGLYLKEAFILYDIAVKEYCVNDIQKIQIIIIMANVGYKLGGVRFAVSVVYEAGRVQMGSTPGRGFDIPFLKKYVFGKVYDNIVTCIMTENLEDNIDNSLWWYYMGVNFLRGTNERAKLACVCIRKAIELALNTEHSSEIGKMYAMISIAEFYGGDKDEALEHAKQALNDYPEQPELWAALILCVFSHREWPLRATWIHTALFQLRRKLYMPRPIREWLRSLERKLNGQE